MAFLVFIDFLHLPPAWKVFLAGPLGFLMQKWHLSDKAMIQAAEGEPIDALEDRNLLT